MAAAVACAPLMPSGVVVGDGGGALGLGECFFEGVEGPADGADAHGGAVAEGVVGEGIVAEEPVVEAKAPGAVRVAVAPLAVGPGVVAVGQQGVGSGDGEDGVIGEEAVAFEKVDIGVFGRVEFVRCAENVTSDGSEHQRTSFEIG
jgi:hypothetical protein